MGVATADELSRQKEQLMRTEQVIFDTNCGQTLQPIIVLQRLDDINSTLRNSEKHIQVTNIRLHLSPHPSRTYDQILLEPNKF